MVLAALALIVLLPVLLVLGAAVRLTSDGPAFYRQVRVGRGGQPFELLKLRTMRPAAAPHQLTVGVDPRITPLGSWLRRHKLDELPQLINVLRGDMALVGPRPEVPELVLLDLPEQREVLQHRPGLTDPASLAFTDEATLLAAEADPESAYRERILPAKLRLSADYLAERSVRSDVGILLRTAVRVLRPC